MNKFSFLLLGVLLSAASCKSAAQLPTVETTYGKVQGYLQEGINIFKGIQFAKPPIGELRWKAPVPPDGWNDIKVCTSFSASPFQPTPAPFYCWTEEFIAPPEPLSEDCLYLNIWSGAATETGKKPVLVWIYGGGFSSGSAACAIYDGAEMAKQGVVFVSMNYRVGPFGFMAHPELSAEQNGASGNYGLLDQIAALRWVQENISAFGGDPGRVTVAGQSAGSMSVQALVASPLAKGLFHGAILQSGSIFNRLIVPLNVAEQNGIALQKKLGVSNLAAMRTLPAEEVLKAAQTLRGVRMGPALDDNVLPKHLDRHFAAGRHNTVPLLVGWVKGDGVFLGAADTTAETFTRKVEADYGSLATQFLEAFPAGTDAEAKQSAAALGMMNFAAYPSVKMAGYNRQPVYLYESGYIPTDKPGFPNYGAFHTSEVPFALHTLHRWNRPWQNRDFRMQELMSGYWLRFVKTGSPNGGGIPVWKPFDSQDQSIFEFDNQPRLTQKLYHRQFAVMRMQDTNARMQASPKK